MLSGCGVKYIENGFGGGCSQHHTTKLQHSTQTNPKVSSLANSQEINTVVNTNETQLNEENQLTKLSQSTTKLSFIQKVKLVQQVRKNIQNSPEVNIAKSNILKQDKMVDGHKSFKQMKNGLDTSEMGIIKLVLVILLALLILGLFNRLLGMSLINLLVLLLLIYLIWVYLF